MNEFSKLWWTQVHGPALFLNEFCQTAARGGCCLLRHSSALPWPQLFQAEVYRRIQMIQGHFRMEEPVDIPDGEAEQWFVDRFLPEHASNFLSTTRLPDFLADTKGLACRLLWLRARTPQQTKQWLELLALFATRAEAMDAIVILAGDGQSPKRFKIKNFDADEAFTAFDVVQLCTVAANVAQCRELFKPYLTHLLNQLCGRDPYRVELLQTQGETMLEDPVAGAACLELDIADIEQRIRRAQLLLLLPIIEDIRIHSLTQLHPQCQLLLPMRDDYGNELDEVYEMELRHIIHYANRGDITMSQHQRTEVETAYNIRNALMHHMAPLPFDDIKQILRISADIANTPKVYLEHSRGYTLVK